ncbi:sodium-dependent glucose transporter 1 isoform X2 [Grus americana]|uniref:sodium-dependent glucose transporter 1 isoform X2 n=1 Tax=Grus americana TaxID=9117 RepID=UPI00240840EC|nr:sodium-dependent glucose transporter 1 isoform X2 [Grus americana]
MAGAEEKKHVWFAAPGEAAAAAAAGPRLPTTPHAEVAVVGGWRCGRGGEGAALRWCISGALCAAFLGLGMSIAVLGPTFQNLAANVHKNVTDIYYIFVGRSLGYLGGSVLGGVLFDCMNAHLLLALSMFGTTVGLYGIPWCKKSLLLTVLMSVIGASMGILDTGGNILALNTWGAEAGPHMQALHFSFAVGAFVAPILAKMALGGSESKDLPVAGKTNQTVLRAVPTASAASAVSALKHRLGADFLWSYVVIGTYLLFVSFVFFILYSKGSSARDKSKASLQKCLFAKYHYALIFLLFVFFFCYVGAEVTYGSYIFTYAKVFAEMKENEAAALNSVFWGAFATCRGVAIFCAACLYPGTMILLSVVGSATSSSCLAFFARYPAVLWVGTAVYGASMATIFPSGISWIEQYTVVQGKSASLFVIGAALGEMCIPAVVGYLQGRFHHVPVVMYAALVTSVMTVILFPLMYKLANCRGESDLKEMSESEDRKALLSNSGLNEDEEDEEDAGEWNEADFEVIEMNDTLRNSVVETSRKIPGDSPAKGSLQPHLGDVSPDSPAVAGGSPGRKNVNVDREKKD